MPKKRKPSDAGGQQGGHLDSVIFDVIVTMLREHGAAEDIATTLRARISGIESHQPAVTTNQAMNGIGWSKVITTFRLDHDNDIWDIRDAVPKHDIVGSGELELALGAYIRAFCRGSEAGCRLGIDMIFGYILWKLVCESFQHDF